MEKRLGRPRVQLDICRLALSELALQANEQLLGELDCASLGLIVDQCQEIVLKVKAPCPPTQPPAPPSRPPICPPPCPPAHPVYDEPKQREDVGLVKVADGAVEGTLQLGVSEWAGTVTDSAKRCGNENAIAVHHARDRKSRARGPGRVTVKKEGIPRLPFMMFSQRHPFRLFWDTVMILLLGYIAVIVPFGLGFNPDIGVQSGFYAMDRFIDVFFLADVLLNFRTGFYKHDGYEVLDWKQVGIHYLKTWFLVDLVSSLPWSDMVGQTDVSNTNAIRLLKSAMMTKTLRLLRLGQGMKLLGKTEIGQIIEETFYSSSANARFTFVGIFFCGLLICHWMACFSSLCGQGYSINFLDSYFTKDNLPSWPEVSTASRYLASLYWAMTTMSTVGYGDILPKSDTERAYTIAAQVLGCGYWGFVLGSMASIISNKDLNTRAYWARMDDVKAWTDHHQFPTNLRRRIRRYFHVSLSKKSAPDEGAIMNDLSPGLRDEVSKLLITDDIRKNRLFAEVPAGALALLVNILYTSSFSAGEVIANEGDVGMAMYIIKEGSAHYEATQEGTLIGVGERILRAGDSFGEEIVMGYEETYCYTITARSEVITHVMSESEFLSLFTNLPSVVKQLQDNYSRIAGDDPYVDADADALSGITNATQGRASLMRGTGQMPLGFPDAVFDSFSVLAKQIDENKKTTQHILRLMNHDHRLIHAHDSEVQKPSISFV